MTGWVDPATKRCPHDNIVHCPLYVASRGLGFAIPKTFVPMYGCCWGDFAEGCAVERGDITYEREIARLCETLEGAALVVELIGQEREDQAKAQRERNMRAAGIH